jgi:hypothetical protein
MWLSEVQTGQHAPTVHEVQAEQVIPGEVVFTPDGTPIWSGSVHAENGWVRIVDSREYAMHVMSVPVGTKVLVAC